MKEMRPTVADDKHRGINHDCLLGDDERKEHRGMVADHKNLAKLVMGTKQSTKENQDDETSHDTLSQLPEGCIAKMSDLGEELGRVQARLLLLLPAWCAGCPKASNSVPFNVFDLNNDSPLQRHPLSALV